MRGIHRSRWLTRWITAAASCLIGFTGACASARVEPLDLGDADARGRVAEAARGHRVEVLTRDGGVHAGRVLAIRGDSLVWVDSRSGEPVGVPFSAVEHVTIPTARNFGDGAVAGAAIGAAGLALLSTSSRTGENYTGPAALAGATFGGVIGGIVGLFMWDRLVFER